MAQDLVTLYNLALSVAGITSGVDSPSEASPEAEQCRLWFEPVRNLILRAAFWPSVKGVKRLGLLATRDTDQDWTSSDPFPGWLYAYALPSDRSEEHTSELQSRENLVCRLLLEKKKCIRLYTAHISL